MNLFLRKENDTKAGVFPAKSEAEARAKNLEGYSVLMPVNELTGGIGKDNVTKILYWYVEIDYKATAKRPLNQLLYDCLIPTKVIETKAGYHVYFAAAEASLNLDNYTTIQDRLCFIYGADRNARNVNRMLRAPGFYHMKDPANPFMCKVVFECDVAYRERHLLGLLDPTPAQIEEREELIALALGKPKPTYKPSSTGIVEYINQANQKDLLEILSGTELVNFEQFKFIKASNGHYNTTTNGKKSGWFIDKAGRIGSGDGGGPTIIQFCLWYGRYNYAQLLTRLEELLWTR